MIFYIVVIDPDAMIILCIMFPIRKPSYGIVVFWTKLFLDLWDDCPRLEVTDFLSPLNQVCGFLFFDLRPLRIDFTGLKME